MAGSDPCGVCCGSKLIRLPVYRPAFVRVPETDVIAVEESSREYPCPECSAGDGMPFEGLGIIKGAKEYPEHLSKNSEFIDRLRYGLAQELVRGMVERGIIRFEQGEPDYRGIFQTRATVGVVAPPVVAKFEERVAERQFEVAEALVKQNIEEIENWGSHYHGRRGGSVQKWQAIEWLQAALKKVRAKYAR